MPRKYDPFIVRRCVRLTGLVNDDIVTFTSKSMTSRDPEDKYHPAVCLATRQVVCDCPHFTYRLAKLNPTVDTPEHLCKHGIRAVQGLRRRGLLDGKEDDQ